MGLYDQYDLANSTGVPAYVGSTLPERTKVMDVLQQRYDNAKFSDDMLARTSADAKINEQDRGLYNNVIDKYRQSMAKRAQSGNYEDMMMDTTRDAYNFASDYKPFAENYGRLQGHIADITKHQDEGKIGTETAQKLIAEMSQYKGLQQDPTTGKYTNYFQGNGIAKDVDVAKKVEDWTKDVVAKETGDKVESIEHNADGNSYYVTRGGTRKVITKDQINRALVYGSQLDPEFNDYVKQKQRLDTLGMDRVTYDQYAQIHPQAAANIKAAADKAGLSFGEVLRDQMQKNVKDQLLNTASGYASKFVTNNHTSEFGLHETEQSADERKKKDDNNIFFQMNIPAYGSDFNTPDKIDAEKVASKQRADNIGQQYSIWANGHNEYGQPIVAKKQADGTTKYTTQDGQHDVTYTAMQQKAMRDQELGHQATLKAIDDQARQESGFSKDPATIRKANAAYASTVSSLNQANSAQGPHKVWSQDEIEAEARKAAGTVLGGGSEGYNTYLDKLKQKASAMTMSTNVSRFVKEEDNKRMEELANNLTNADFKQSLVGAWGTGTNGGNKQLTPDDYENLKGNIKFAGTHVDSQGQQQAIFSAENPKTHDKYQFALKGFTTKQPLSKMIGVDATSYQMEQGVRAALDNPAKTHEFPLGHDGTSLEVKVNDGTGSSSADKYIIRLKAKDGRSRDLGASDENGLLNIMRKLQ